MSNLSNIKIRDIGEQGEGIGSLPDGKTCFVPGLLPGEEAEIEIQVDKKSYSVGEIKSISQTSPSRIEAPCIHFQECGGCQIMHLDYAKQLDFKQNKVHSTLEKIAGLKLENVQKDFVPSPAEWQYRNKISLPVRGSSKHPLIGFYKSNSHEVVDIDACPVSEGEHSEILSDIKHLVHELRIPVYQEKKNIGLLKHIILRYSPIEKAYLMVFVLHCREKDNYSEILPLIEYCYNQASIFSCFLNFNPKEGNRISSFKYKHVYGLNSLSTQLLGIDVELQVDSFLQLNRQVAESLYQSILGFLPNGNNENVLDLYCGPALLTYRITQKKYRIYACELNRQAIQTAKQLFSSDTDLADYYLEVADASAYLDTVSDKVFKYCLTNPPRKGMDIEVINKLGKMDIEKIIYTSCKVSTLARDIKRLREFYPELKVEHLQSFDMMPQTTQVETVAVIQLKGE